MLSPQTKSREKAKRDMAKKAIALVMNSRWSDAVAINQAIVGEFPEDLEAYNRLGKALAELGRNNEARAAFQRALDILPSNSIANKNLSRLTHLVDDTPRTASRGPTAPRVFIEETGKTGITSVVDLAPSNALVKLAPGHPMVLKFEAETLTVCDSDGSYVGQVEPKLATRLLRLQKGGNRYEARVTRVSEDELTVIIRETYKHQNQATMVSFPTRKVSGRTELERRAQPPATSPGESTDEVGKERADVKDWSSDDTEPGDDDAFTPVLHRIVNPDDEDDPDQPF